MQINDMANHFANQRFHSSVDKEKNNDRSTLSLQVQSSQTKKKEDPIITSITNEISRLQDEKKKLSTNTELSESEIIAKSKDITDQITELRKQLEQRKAEVQKAEKEKEIQKQQEKEQEEKEQEEKEQNPESMSTLETTTLVKVGSLMSDISSLSFVRTHASGEVHRIKGAIAANQARNMSSADALESQLTKAESTFDSITHDMVKKYGEIQSTLKNYIKVQKDSRTQSAEEDRKKEKEEEEKESKNERTSFDQEI